MINEELMKKIEYDFIALSKVVNHKVGMSAAAVLATMIYKYKYWENKEELTTKGNLKGFYISHSDLKEETCLGLSQIKKAIKELKEENLIRIKRQGQGKPNLYGLDETNINQYIEDNEEDYNNWRLKIREENSSETLINSLIGENRPSRESKIDLLDSSKSTTTKNKSTKNKKLKTNTNRINAVSEIGVSEEDLMTKISELQESKLEDRPVLYKEFYRFLRDSVSMFENFKASDSDFELIESLIDSPCESHFIANKIKENARSIMDKRKDCRFGNLFVGIQEMSENFSAKYPV